MKKLIVIVVSIVAMQAIIAQPDSCLVLLEKISGEYSGKCQDGLANGKGKSIGEDTYTGIFKDGLPHGKGKYIFKNGDIYDGYWINGKKDGKGKFKYSINGVKHTLTGYWKEGEYMGVTDPDVSYRVTSTLGIFDYKVEEKESTGKYDNTISISIRSAFTEYTPGDLKIENSSGQILQSGKKHAIVEYFCPLQCTISYTILVGELEKQCLFVIDILQEGKYAITLSND